MAKQIDIKFDHDASLLSEFILSPRSLHKVILSYNELRKIYAAQYIL